MHKKGNHHPGHQLHFWLKVTKERRTQLVRPLHQNRLKGKIKMISGTSPKETKSNHISKRITDLTSSMIGKLTKNNSIGISGQRKFSSHPPEEESKDAVLH